MKPRLVLAFSLMILMLLSACNLPVAPSMTPTTTAYVMTAAAQTIDAMQTQQIIVTPLPPDTPTAPPAETAADTPAPAEAGPTATDTPQPCDQAGFVKDVTVDDGTDMLPGQAFVKTWRLKNTGSCTWTTGYAMIFSSGEAMGAPASIGLAGNVPPGETVDLSINMKAPTSPGSYSGYWKLRNAQNQVFGVGPSNGPFYVQIDVINGTPGTPSPTPSGGTVTPTATPAPGLLYDFVGNMCKADWRSDAGSLNCPGSPSDTTGFVVQLDAPTLETGAVEHDPVMMTHPRWVDDGVITGAYPAQPIQQGEHFKATLGCRSGAEQCSVIYQLNYREGNANPQNLGQWTQTYDSSIQGVDVDLSSFAGRSIQLILVVLANGPSTQDHALWINPRLAK